MALRLATALAGEAAEGNDLLLVENVVEVLLRADERHALDRSADLAHVLEARAHIHRASLRDDVDVLRVVRVVVRHRSQKTNKTKTTKITTKKYKNKKNQTLIKEIPLAAFFVFSKAIFSPKSNSNNSIYKNMTSLCDVTQSFNPEKILTT